MLDLEIYETEYAFFFSLDEDDLDLVLPTDEDLEKAYRAVMANLGRLDAEKLDQLRASAEFEALDRYYEDL